MNLPKHQISSEHFPAFHDEVIESGHIYQDHEDIPGKHRHIIKLPMHHQS